MLEIVTLQSLQNLSEDQKKEVLLQIEDIFFEASSKKTFLDPEKKAAFFKRWCGDYEFFFPEEFFIAMEGPKVLGYLSGCSDSFRAMNVLNVPGFATFQDLFNIFPAHLHINFHTDARGKGLGSLLMKHYMDHLKLNNVMGVHLITSPDAQNVSFFKRLGFDKVHTRTFNEMPLFFMGCVLIPE